MSGYDRRLAEANDRYQAALAKAGELRRKIGEISATATAPRQVVKVTVGAQGEVRAVEFPVSAYKRMPPAELAATLMSTIGEARQKALEAFRDLMQPEMPAGLNVMDLLQGKVGSPALRPEGPPIPDAVREYLEQGRGPHGNGVRHE